MAETLTLIRDGVIIVGGVILTMAALVVIRQITPLVLSLRQLSAEMTDVARSLEDRSKQIGEAIISARALTDSVTDTHRRTIEPTLRNVEEISRELNATSRHVSQIVEQSADFSRSTLRQATFYRDKVFRPIIELASLWNGIRAVARVMPKGKLLKLAGRRKQP